MRGRPPTVLAMALVLLLGWQPSTREADGAVGSSEGEQRIVDAAVDAGIYEITRTWSANVGDLDLDGWPDLLLVRHGNATSRLYQNQAGRFAEIDAGTFIRRDRHDCAWGDVNQDDRPDVYCSIGGDQGSGTGEKELWMQRPDRSFVNAAGVYGVQDPYGRGRRGTFIDVNHDPYPDLFAGNAYPRTDPHPTPNRLFINEAGSSFRDATEYGITLEVGALCAEAADYDEDGWEDLLVCGQEEWGVRLYRNDGGTRFLDVTVAAGVSGYSKGATLADLNGDGHLDLARVRSDIAAVQLQSGGTFQAPVTVASGLSRGRWIAAGDADGDGDIDLYVLQGCRDDLSTNYPDLMLLNDGGGTAFTEATIPQATQGCGDNAEPIDYNRDGNTDFVVLNGIRQTEGYQVRGPIQLISFVDPTEVQVADYSYTPATASVPRGAVMHWTFDGPSSHTVTDVSGMGLFDSGPVGPGGSFSVDTNPAGSFGYACTIHPWMTGVLAVPVGATPAVGGTTTQFTVRWAETAPAPGRVFDVQITRPGGAWTNWKMGQQTVSSTFTPDAGTGVYEFRARLRQPGIGKASGYSPPTSVTVS